MTLCFSSLFFLCLSLQASETLGKCFPIEERDMRELILEKRGVSLEKFHSEQIETLKFPKPVQGLKKAKKQTKRKFDPTIIVKKAITDNKGHIIVPKGKRYNPLWNISLKNGIAIFDAEDKEQYSWAKSKKKEVSWVIIRGRPLEIEEEMEKSVYFDQNGVLTDFFWYQGDPCPDLSRRGDTDHRNSSNRGERWVDY